MTTRDFPRLPMRAAWRATFTASTMALWLVVPICSCITVQGADTPISRDGLLERFKMPPDGYGPIDCWWWEAGRLSKDRMRWQLEDLKAKGVSGTYYYPRYVYGQPLSCDPPYWTEGWWDFTKFAAEEHRRLGLRGWFSDWTAHRFFQNKVFEDAKKEPALQGRCLVIHEAESSADKVTQVEIPQNEEIIDAAAFRRTPGNLDFASRRDLRDAIRGRTLSWKAGEAGWVVTVVTTRPQYLDYLNRAVVERWLKYSMEVYREKLPGLLGSPVEVFGPDEMEVLDGAILYNPTLVSIFRTKKGYDPIPYLVGLFHDIGPKTEKLRCEYYETMVSLLEENWYRPIPQWLHDHGMKYADFCPRGKDNDFLAQTFHYGDYFSKMCHFDRLGSEEHAGRPRAYSFFAKTSSSVIHLYGGDRVGVCCYWLSGWGHNTQENQAWTNENYTYGVNLYNLHGGLYETLGGWYEWVPPEVDYRQPYWKYWKHFTGYITRLSYILSQGVHVSDVAILYPMSTIHAHWSGGNNFGPPAKEAAQSSVQLAQELFYRGIDFNFIDYPSVRRATVRDGKLTVSGLEFRVFLLPPMTTIRTETLEKIKEFHDAGGTVVAFKTLPRASAENGREDPNILRLVESIFGVEPGKGSMKAARHENQRGGKAFFVPEGADRVHDLISSAVDIDVITAEKDLLHIHQRAGNVDVYFFYNMKEEKRRVSLALRVAGEPEIWNAFTREARPLCRFQHEGKRTTVRFDIGPQDGVLLVLAPGGPRPQVIEDDLDVLASVQTRNEGIEVQALCDSGGEKRARILHQGKQFFAKAGCAAPPEPIALDGVWDFRLAPTMDNRWGDFRYPPSQEFIGAEARRFRYAEEGAQKGTELRWHESRFDDSAWPEVNHSHGPFWWTIGPFEEGSEPPELRETTRAAKLDADVPYQTAGKTHRWQRYRFSQDFGSDDLQVQSADWGGLLGVAERFISFDGVKGERNVTRYLLTYVYSPEDADYDFLIGANGDVPRRMERYLPSVIFPGKAWINGELVVSLSPNENNARKTVRLKKGFSTVLLKLVQPHGKRIEGFAVFQRAGEPPFFDPYVPRLRWFVKPCNLTYHIKPEWTDPVGWYRFQAPPGLRSMRFSLKAKSVTVWVDGKPVGVRPGARPGDSPWEAIVSLGMPIPRVSQVVLRVDQTPGLHEGAAFSSPVMFDCDRGEIPLGDWCQYGLRTYSGCGVYAKTVTLGPQHVNGAVIVDLGGVATLADVRVNGTDAGVRLARPYEIDISRLVRVGSNPDYS